MNVLRRIGLAATTTLLTAAALTLPTPAQAGTVVPQAGPNPVVITPGTGRDDLVVLPATAAERDSDIQVHQDGDIAKNHSTGRGVGDLNDDVHHTTTNGNSASYTFTGTGIDVLGPKGSTSGNFDIHLDNVLIGRFNANAATYTPQSVVYSARHLTSGTHTVRLTKVDSTHLQLDGYRVVPNPVTHNNNAAIVTYNGAWTYSGNRGVGDHNNDVTWSATNGNSFTVTFTGTGLKIRGPMSTGDGTATITVDGAPASTVKATHSGNYTAQQLYWATDHLTPGTHTVTVTKTGGTWLQLDSVTVIP